MTRTWFITGAANGLGRDITEEVLARGDQVAATARRPEELADLVQTYGERIEAIELDVRDAQGAEGAVAQAIKRFGRLDVIVNNAGYGKLSAFEDTDADSFRDQIDTNLYGTIFVTRAALPHLRRQRSGHILQISSVGGRVASPGLSAYQTAKWAVGGFSGVLAAEMAPLGIKVTVVEPGGMKTNWAARTMGDAPEISPDYEETVGRMLKLRSSGEVNLFTSDPRRVAKILFELAGHDNPPLKLLIGSDAVANARRVEDARRESDERWEAVSRSADAKAEAFAAMPE
ncbi:SDR family NAD(P)-dependent oxidoreductase [Neorhizobium alkalisoli]|uniref:NADP-dependent 3-hydroxy acid dehydrogenase YdfG n=1 Tax=Neorhizobium alkalisoli TaxID=528178 RepID=A0A561R341_9HYPH|nr:SDR family NAD(P)-dependent oxidoreductase [Neorhizobium alkalisoli]TWF57027.1 NADP-dependent 3-hydroxy acid dehydrogenase YdfG [Neorhizobium alkalisoli]